MLCCNEKLKVRYLEKKDNRLLAKWLSNPKVLEFYEGRDNPFDVNKVNEVFYPKKNNVTACIFEYDGTPIGYIQYYQLNENDREQYGLKPEPITIFGLDQFIGEVDYWNKGIGTLLVSSMSQFLVRDLGAKQIVLDPQARNLRAIKCYEKCSFKKIKWLPNHELHEGEYQDCWLMAYNP
ncbi:GNAT family N-acetyltransferase [Aquibacillus kalidii]|uniref:GNAT family N-acetyltransferase n=1 Tax=Aquibacillus kalidii TaxID=2762597 RepID=UPI0016464DDD|nr:GNAT family N-acetyltransferase [Aquibacillus kalidii]